MAQRSLLTFFGKRSSSSDSVPSTSSTPGNRDLSEIEKKKRRKEQKDKYEEDRERLFQVKWLKEFAWLTVDDESEPPTMLCKVCLEHPNTADRKSSLFVGCSNFRKQTLQSIGHSFGQVNIKFGQVIFVITCPTGQVDFFVSVKPC